MGMYLLVFAFLIVGSCLMPLPGHIFALAVGKALPHMLGHNYVQCVWTLYVVNCIFGFMCLLFFRHIHKKTGIGLIWVSVIAVAFMQMCTFYLLIIPDNQWQFSEFVMTFGFMLTFFVLWPAFLMTQYKQYVTDGKMKLNDALCYCTIVSTFLYLFAIYHEIHVVFA